MLKGGVHVISIYLIDSVGLNDANKLILETAAIAIKNFEFWLLAWNVMRLLLNPMRSVMAALLDQHRLFPLDRSASGYLDVMRDPPLTMTSSSPSSLTGRLALLMASALQGSWRAPA